MVSELLEPTALSSTGDGFLETHLADRSEDSRDDGRSKSLGNAPERLASGEKKAVDPTETLGDELILYAELI